MIRQDLILFAAAVVGGTLNAVAGGGSFFTFPALLLARVPAIPANATSTVALWPGSVASVAAYRREVGRAPHLIPLSAASVVGGAVGAELLLHTPAGLFSAMVPYLLLGATALFAVGGVAARWVRRLQEQRSRQAGPRARGPLGLAGAQLVIAAYGGFFGGGIGILMLSALRLAGLDDMHTMNAVKTLQAALINGVAVAIFIIAGKVFWPQALVMVVGAVLGGYGGAAGARHVDPRLIRALVIVVGCAMSAYFFWRG